MTLAIKHINAARGVLGKELEVVSQDDACDSAKVTLVAAEMIEEKVIKVIGHICNNSTEAALPSHASANIPVISAASTNPNLTNDGKYPNFFRTISHDASQAHLQVEFAKNQIKQKSRRNRSIYKNTSKDKQNQSTSMQNLLKSMKPLQRQTK